MTFTAAELAACARREVAQRERVYPRLITSGKMDRRTAERQIAMMEQIARDYAAKAKSEGLFGEEKPQ